MGVDKTIFMETITMVLKISTVMEKEVNCLICIFRIN